MAAAGRHPDSLRVLPGVRTFVADTEQDALNEHRQVFAESSYYAGRLRFIKREAPVFDLDGLDLDGVIPADWIPSREKLASNHRRVSRGLISRDLITELDHITLRQFLQRTTSADAGTPRADA